MPELPLLPPRLRRGATIGLFCPAGPVRDPERLRAGIRLIEDLGFLVKLQGPMEPQPGYLAAGDEQRVAHLHALWSDESVQALVAIRGGYGCLRLMDLVDWDLCARQPKFFVGFSDVTLLLNTLVERSGLVTLHGPMATTLSRSGDSGLHALFALLTGDFEPRLRPKGLEVLRGGTARGRLMGGNLTTLVHSLATPWEPTWDGRLLVLEDTGESLYRVDRMLTHLAAAGRLQRLAGLMLGDFDQGTDEVANLRLQEAIWARTLELMPPGIPVWGQLPVGHQARNIALPLGMEAVMDSSGGALQLLPASVALA